VEAAQPLVACVSIDFSAVDLATLLTKPMAQLSRIMAQFGSGRG
jgi:hypothetical protein